MPKRMTATEKWMDPWYCALTPTNKLFWLYLLDNCDHAGIWMVNWPLVKFHLWEDPIDPKLFGDRIVVINAEKWHIPKFIEFQYGQLNPGNKVHASVIDLLTRAGVAPSKGLGRGIEGAKVKDNTTTQPYGTTLSNSIHIRKSHNRDKTLIAMDDWEKEKKIREAKDETNR